MKINNNRRGREGRNVSVAIEKEKRMGKRLRKGKKERVQNTLYVYNSPSSIIVSPSLWACTARVVAMMECRMRGSSCPVMSDRSRGACPPNTSVGGNTTVTKRNARKTHSLWNGAMVESCAIHTSIYLASLCTCLQ